MWTNLLWRYIKCLCSHVNLLIDIHTGDDEEDPRPPGSSWQQPSQSEDDGSLVLLDHLDGEEEREGEGAEDDEDAGDGEKEGAETRTLLAGGYKQRFLAWEPPLSSVSLIPLLLFFIFLSEFLCCDKSSNMSGLSVLVITIKHFARQASLLTFNNWVASQ